MSEVVQELERCLQELPGEGDTLSNVTAVTSVRRAAAAGRPLGVAAAGDPRRPGARARPSASTWSPSTRRGSSPPAASTSVHLRATTAYDPDGTNGEHNAQAPLATDDLASTGWQTESYRDAPSLGKPGVGLVLDAGRSVSLHRITVVTSTPGFVARIQAGGAPDSFPDIVSTTKTTAARTVFDLTGGPHRYYLLWIMRLGPGFDNARIVQVSGS